jgi:peptidoglycan/LPS O-acetylase OafA/YrhL
MHPSLTPTKPHYAILDGLRGVAAILVVIFHLFEAHTLGDHQNQIINHGYLAVDFFFMLSGFVVGYAYDDRWGTMTVKEFVKIRLIRLQPMVVVGTLVGAALFYAQDSGLFPHIHEVPLWHFLLILAIGVTLIPVLPSMDIRGWGELHPLNGPGWSLFYEYLANFLYAVWIRRWSNLALGVWVGVSALAVIWLTVFGPAGEVSGGWSLDAEQIRIGLTRVMFPFFGGLLLSRTARLVRIPNAFIWCSLFLLLILCWPRVGGPDKLWLNGVYESVCILIVFPIIVYMGAGGVVKGAGMQKVCTFLGAISYPIYITHYPLIYSYTAWVVDHKVSMGDGWPWGLATLAASLLLAYGSLKFYDEPVRKWLRGKM